MRWREGDRGREGAEIISRKVLMQTDSWRVEALFKVKPRYQSKKTFNHFSTFVQKTNISVTSSI